MAGLAAARGDEPVVTLLRDLIALESVNPAYAGGGAGEAAVADYVAAWGAARGLTVARQPVLPGRDNVVLTLTVPGATHTLLLEAHMDTVALAPMGERALRPEIRDGRLYGRGACDTKGSLAAMLAALAALQRERAALSTNVVLLAAVDEEHAFRGILAYIASGLPVDAAVVGEPTDLRAVIAHKGCVRGRIMVRGRAAHSAEPARGVSAIDGMAEVLLALRDLPPRLRERRHPLLGTPTWSVGLIEGGAGVNIVPEQCTITYDRRTLPGEEPEAALAEVDRILAVVQAARPDLTVERAAPDLVSEALDTPADAAVVLAVRAACRRAGLQDAPIGVPYGTDASKLWRRRGVPSVVCGPGAIAQAHGADEFVPLDQLRLAVQVYTDVARQLAGALPAGDVPTPAHDAEGER
jgi:acetylornithine deacetylase/succinyl-diaminopimelate desuccinylase-like protein